MIVTAGTEAAELRDAGCELLILPDDKGRLALAALLDELGRRRMTNLLVEGGSAVLGSLLDASEIDEVHVWIAPSLLGGSEALTPAGGRGAERIADALSFTDLSVETLAGDVLIHGWRALL
jgi:diaminohydroxyphosphoribosylaminopyrimidine deaminase/5-amino-6-(5-phosphoribosylamino)uracil reductase